MVVETTVPIDVVRTVLVVVRVLNEHVRTVWQDADVLENAHWAWCDSHCKKRGAVSES